MFSKRSSKHNSSLQWTWKSFKDQTVSSVYNLIICIWVKPIVKLKYNTWQVDNDPFNRGKLMNVGYKEAMKYFPYDCLVFHDVDLLLEDDRLLYNCQSSPQHLSVSLNKFKYRSVLFFKNMFLKLHQIPMFMIVSIYDNLRRKISQFNCLRHLLKN